MALAVKVSISFKGKGITVFKVKTVSLVAANSMVVKADTANPVKVSLAKANLANTGKVNMVKDSTDKADIANPVKANLDKVA
jgi:hypothetical protein